MTLPLEGLFERLERAGFDCSPAVRLRAWSILSLAGPTPPDPVRLRLLLGPLFAHSADEQKRFYDLFDRYWESLLHIEPEPEPEPDEPPQKPWYRQPNPALQGAAALLVLSLGMYLIWHYLKPPKSIPPVPTITLNTPAEGHYRTDDPVQATINTPLDTTQYTYTWHLTANYDSTLLEGPHNTPLWDFPCPAPTQANLQVALRTRPNAAKTTLKTGDTYQPLPIACDQPPTLPRLRAPQSAKVGQTLRFAVTDRPKPGLRYTWDAGDTTAQGPVFTHQFQQEGPAEVRFSVADTTQPGHCQRDTTLYISVGQTRATLPLLPLAYDQPSHPTARFRWPLWALLALLVGAALWYWARWAWRKAPEPPPAEPEPAPRLPQGWGQSSDRPPYYIPFREPKGALRSAPAQLRFGDALRKRQTGEDWTFDILRTLRATLDNGGFPKVALSLRTRPAEYLFLAPEQMPGRHLARLFRHVAEHLRGQDVLLDLLWYDADLQHCWGKDGRAATLDQLRRLYPQHRLVLLGDGHALLDPYAEAAPRLRPGLEAALQGWKERLLLTPQPPDAWNWRERTLYQHFGLFPADLRGLLDAATFVEGGLDLEDLPPRFETWQTRQTKARAERPDPNYRRWRTLADHHDYLRAAAPDPQTAADLQRWLSALAVLPNPTWEVSLLTALALGIAPTHDRLLALARIPWLRDGNLNPRLRRELLANLSDADERAARIALRDELAELQPQTADSHAAHELESALAIQLFLLDPENPDTQQLIAGFLDANALTRIQEDELNLAVGRWETRQTPPPNQPTPTLPLGDIRAWLAERRPPPPEAPPPPPKPFFTPDFWKASTATAAALLLAGCLWALHDTAALRRMAFDAEAAAAKNTPRQNPLVAEYWPTDSAAIWNNRGVDALPYGNLDPTALDYPAALRAFDRALDLRPSYPLAEQNRLRAWYNWGCARLNNPAAARDSLLRAEACFGMALEFAAPGMDTTSLRTEAAGKKRNAAPRYPQERLDAAHGQGLAAFYAGRRDRAALLYRRLAETTYFDTLQRWPNLKTLLGILEKPLPAWRDPWPRPVLPEVQAQWLTNPQTRPALRDSLRFRRPKVRAIVFSWTASKATAATMHAYFEKGNGQAAVHYIVDAQTLLQCVPDREWCYFLGNPDRYRPAAKTLLQGMPNRRAEEVALAIELCDGSDSDSATWAATRANAARLARALLRRHGLGTDALYRQYDLNGKESPQKLLDPAAWEAFKREVAGAPATQNPATSPNLQTLLADIARSMILIKGGTFKMGSDEKDEDASDNEKPAHDVRLSDYYMGRTEVTVAQFKAFIEDSKYQTDADKEGWSYVWTGSDYEEKNGVNWRCDVSGAVRPDKDHNHPVIHVSWNDAVAYCGWLSKKTEQQYRLPTEAEWEYAARGGVAWQDTLTYSGSNNLDEVGWYSSNSNRQTHPVAQKKPNQRGLYDMSGNVWEWCRDWYKSDYYKNSPKDAPQGADSGSLRVIRGGSWFNDPRYCRVAYRYSYAPGDRYYVVGFRLARTD